MPEDLDNSNDAEQQPEDSPVIRGLRDKANRTDTAEARAVAAERELTVHKAGLGTLSEKQMKALTAAHDGDWDPELLKATATELGFVQQPGEEQKGPQIPAGELDAQRRVAEAAGGEPPAAPPELDAAIAATQSPEELTALLTNAGLISAE